MTPVPPGRAETPPNTLIEALRHRLQRSTDQPIRLIETHISWVLLDGRHAWKIKKPVRLGFLDFSDLATRKHYSEEELRLNRRLAPGLYEQVVPIHGSAGAPRLEGEDPPIEYALRMKQFPPGALLSERLAAGTLEVSDLDRFAERLARFHAQAPSAARDTAYGTVDSIVATVVQALDGLEQRIGSERCAAVRAWLGREGVRLRPGFDRRKAEGWVREGHGDLHLANVVALDDEFTAFDCIEFDPALSWIDVQCDLAFFVMDLMAHGQRELAFRALDRWLQHIGDYAGLAVLRWYLVYRAIVRALVAGIRREQGLADDSPDYLALVDLLVMTPSPRLMITHGLSGSGKSFVSQRLLEQARAIRLRSDVERKRLHGLSPLVDSASRVPGGIYGGEATDRTYARLVELAGVALEAGFPVIVDAAFLQARERERFRELASRLRVPFTVLHCRAEPGVLRERVVARAASRTDPSEADLAVLERQLSQVEPLTELERAHSIELDTGAAAGLELDRVRSITRRWLDPRQTDTERCRS